MNTVEVSNPIDLIFLAHGRERFTAASLRTLFRNTHPSFINKLHIFTDGKPALPPAWLAPAEGLIEVETHTEQLGGPVAVMNRFLAMAGAPIFAKIDNDVILPPGWLKTCIGVMLQHPDLDLLGIEPPASRTPSRKGGRRMAEPELSGPVQRAPGAFMGYARTPSIGGIGLMRRSAWRGSQKMTPSGFRGVGGFTGWQLHTHTGLKGWIAPPLKVFLLDRMPVAPWYGLSQYYIGAGIQRPWQDYDPKDAKDLWAWWTEDNLQARAVIDYRHEPTGASYLLECGHWVHMALRDYSAPIACGQCLQEFVADDRI